MAKHIYFIRKSVALHLFEGPDQGRTTDRDIGKKREKKPSYRWESNSGPFEHKFIALTTRQAAQTLFLFYS